MGWLKYVPYVGKGLQWLEFFAEQSPYWPKRWPKPSTWAEHKVERALEYLARNEGRAFDAEAFGSYVGMSRKRYGFFTPDSAGRGKKTRFSDFGSTARNLDQEFRDAAGAHDAANQTDNLGGNMSLTVGGGPAGQYGRLKTVSGRKRSRKGLLKGLTNMSADEYIVRYQNVSPYASDACAYALNHLEAPILGGTTLVTSNQASAIYPVHLFDLTCLPMVVDGMGATTKPIETFRINPMWYLASDEAGRFRWRQVGIRGMGLDGVAGTNQSVGQDANSPGVNHARWYKEVFKCENNDVATVGQYVNLDSAIKFREKVALRWSDIRLQFNMPRTDNTNVDVYLVQFKDPDMDPYSNGITYNGTSFDVNTTNSFHRAGIATIDEIPAEAANEFDQYCKSWLKPRMFNPMDVVHREVPDAFRILHHRRIRAIPDTTTNEDPSRSVVDVKMFHRHDKIFNTTWDDQNPVYAPAIEPNKNVDLNFNGAPVELDTVRNEMENAGVQTYPGGTSRAHPYMHPSSRVYLMIVSDCWKAKPSRAPQNVRITVGTTNYDPIVPTSNNGPNAPEDPLSEATFVATDQTGVNAGSMTSYNIILRNKWMCGDVVA